MDSILSAIKDLAKFKIIASISTGDKTYDNLLSGALIAILTYVFTFQVDRHIKLYYYKRKETFDSPVNSMLYNWYSDRLNDCGIIFYDISPDNKEFYSRIIKYMFRKIGHYLDTTILTIQFDKSDKILLQNDRNYAINKFLISGKLYPIYISNEYRIYARLSLDRYYLQLGCNSYQLLEKFIARINADTSLMELPIETPENKNQRCIFNTAGQHESSIPLYRSMDFIITRHKPLITRALDNFIEVNKPGYKHTILTNYNLGFIFYGAPGTGKTSLTKAIANYLKKSIRVVNLTKTNTMRELKMLLLDSQFITVFEEFDFMQGVLTRDGENKSDANFHRERLIGLMKEKAQIKEEKALKTFDEEIDRVKKLIEDCENRITLDGFLTILDGLNEVRGRVIIATTNYIDKIDPALIREGRFDYKLSLDRFNENEIRELLCHAFPAETETINATKFPEDKFTPVQITNICKIHHSLPKIIEQLTA